MAQRAVIANAVEHGGHQGVDELACRRESVYADAVLGLLVEHDVVQVITVVPDAEFRAHTVVADRRAKHLRRGSAKRRHHRLQASDFLGELSVVLFGWEMFGGHDAS